MHPKFKTTPTGVIHRNEGKPTHCWGLHKKVNGVRLKESSRLYRRNYLTDKDWYEANERWYAQRLERITRVTTFGEIEPRSFLEASERYLKDHRGKLRDVKEFVRLLSVANEFLGPVLLQEISPHHSKYQAYLASLKERGIRNKTINNYIDPVSRVVNYSTTVRDDGGNPWLVHQVKFPQLPVENQRAPRVLTWEEQELLLDRLPGHLACITEFILQTGLRSGECSTLKWKDLIAFNGKYLLAIYRSKTNHGKKMPVPLNSTALEILHTCGLESKLKTDGYIFLNESGKTYTQINGYDWKKWVRGVISRKRKDGWIVDPYPEGLGWDLRVHDLRHTFGHRLNEVGCPWEDRQLLLGHTPKNVTSHYSQPSIERLQQWVEKIQEPSTEATPILRL